jgi:hypothetical protein
MPTREWTGLEPYERWGCPPSPTVLWVVAHESVVQANFARRLNHPDPESCRRCPEAALAWASSTGWRRWPTRRSPGAAGGTGSSTSTPLAG